MPKAIRERESLLEVRPESVETVVFTALELALDIAYHDGDARDLVTTPILTPVETTWGPPCQKCGRLDYPHVCNVKIAL